MIIIYQTFILMFFNTLIFRLFIESLVHLLPILPRRPPSSHQMHPPRPFITVITCTAPGQTIWRVPHSTTSKHVTTMPMLLACGALTIPTRATASTVRGREGDIKASHSPRAPWAAVRRSPTICQGKRWLCETDCHCSDVCCWIELTSLMKNNNCKIPSFSSSWKLNYSWQYVFKINILQNIGEISGNRRR